MLQWSLFYTILKIPDTVEDPSAYQLLSLDPGSLHSPKKIAQALESQKRTLRQHIPNPQFIPMLVTFENELDQAAATLTDPARREAHDRKLLQESSTGDSQAILKRKQSVAKARKAVAGALDIDGTIDDNQRLALAKKLKEFGLRSAVIQQLLSRIPTAQQASDLNKISFRAEVKKTVTQGVISMDDENTLIEMGIQLNFSRSEIQAIIDEVLQGRKSKIVKPPTSPTRKKVASKKVAPKKQDSFADIPGFDNLPSENDLVKSHLKTQSASASSKDDNPLITWLLQIALPVLTIAAFTASVVFYAKQQSKSTSDPQLSTSLQIPADQQPSNTTETLTSTDTWTQPGNIQNPASSLFVSKRTFDINADKRDVVKLESLLDPPEKFPLQKPAAPQTLATANQFEFTNPVGELYKIQPENNSSNNSTDIQFNENSPSAILTDPAAQAAQGPLARAIRQGYTSDLNNYDYLLNDIAATILATAQKVAQVTSTQSTLGPLLEKLINQPNRFDTLVKDILYQQTTPVRESRNNIQPITDSKRTQLLAKLASQDQAEAYEAIAQLGELIHANVPGSLQLLLDTLDQQAASATGRKQLYRISRMLDQLRQINDPVVPNKIIDLLARTRNDYLAHHLTFILRDTAMPQLKSPSPGLLPAEHKRSARTKAVQFWRNQFGEMNLWWNPKTITTHFTIDSPQWNTFSNRVRLVGRASIDYQYILSTLSEFSWVPNQYSQKHTLLTFDEQQLLDSEKELLEDLKMRVRAMKNDGKSSNEMDNSTVVHDDVLSKLTIATEQTVWELTRLISNHPNGKNSVIAAEMIFFDHRKHLLLADTKLQQIAINLDTSSRLMELLCIAVGGEKKTSAHIEAIRSDRKENQQQAPNIAVDIRNNAYRNLVLWEMLSQFNVKTYSDK